MITIFSLKKNCVILKKMCTIIISKIIVFKIKAGTFKNRNRSKKRLNNTADDRVQSSMF